MHRRGLVFASRKANRKANRRARRRTAKQRRTARRSSRRLGISAIHKAQRGGYFAYRVPGDATRDFQRMEDDGFSQPIMVTQEEVDRMTEDERM
jgi:hypothetical protein